MPTAQNHKYPEVPTASIGLPVYNGERFIREALDSALNQTFGDFELIISDNNSSDATEEICREYGARDPRIKYIRHEKNYGSIWNFNFVAERATGRFFTWLAHDDVLNPEFLEQTVQYMLGHAEVVIAAVDFKIIDENGAELRVDRLEEFRDSRTWVKRRIPFFEFGYPRIHLCFYGLMRADLCKSIVEKVRTPQMLTGWEYPILARFAAVGEVAALPTILRMYRSHDSGLFLTEVADIKRKPKWRGLWFFYSNLSKTRVDLFQVLIRSNLPLRSKFTILLRHLVLDLKWCRHNIGLFFWHLLKFVSSRLRVRDQAAE